MSELIKRVKNHVISLLVDNLSENLLFHNLNHTFEVVAAAREIGVYSSLSKEEMEVVIIAAWFHDSGYTELYSGHEEKSKEIAMSFLMDNNCEEEKLISILNCIEATKFPQNPQTLCEKIICDADMYHLTKPNYPIYAEALYNELKFFLNLNVTELQWRSSNYNFLVNHSYNTFYGKEILNKFKNINVESIILD